MAEVKPTAFFGVPRIFEKVMAGIQALLAAEQDEARKAAVAAAMATGLEYVRSCQFGQTTSPELAAKFAAAEEQVLRPIRSLLGLGETEIVGERRGAAAAGGRRVLRRARRADHGRVRDERDDRRVHHRIRRAPSGSALSGKPVPGIEVRIADDGEILTRGPLNTPGYLNLPEQTADLIDADGWLHTGDIGAIDPTGSCGWSTGRRS